MGQRKPIVGGGISRGEEFFYGGKTSNFAAPAQLLKENKKKIFFFPFIGEKTGFWRFLGVQLRKGPPLLTKKTARTRKTKGVFPV